MTQKMCEKVVFEDPLLLKNWLDSYKIQEMYEKAVDAFLPTLKLCPIGLLQI